MTIEQFLQHALGPFSGLVITIIGSIVLYKLMEKERAEAAKERQASLAAQNELVELLKNEINQCQSRYDVLKEDYYELKLQCTEQQREIEELKREIKDLQAENKLHHPIGAKP